MDILILYFDFFRLFRNILKYVNNTLKTFKTSYVVSRCKTFTINVDKRWLNVIRSYYEKILVNILRKNYLILVNVLLISYLYCKTLFVFIMSLIFHYDN